MLILKMSIKKVQDCFKQRGLIDFFFYRLIIRFLLEDLSRDLVVFLFVCVPKCLEFPQNCVESFIYQANMIMVMFINLKLLLQLVIYLLLSLISILTWQIVFFDELDVFLKLQLSVSIIEFQ